MRKSPDTDQLPWSPVEVIQVDIAPEYIVECGAMYKQKRTKIRNLATSQRFANAFAAPHSRSIAYYERIKQTPNLFTIAIGVFKETHKGVDLVGVDSDGDTFRYKGSDIPYEYLFEYLATGIPGKNFDPLRVVRDRRADIERQISYIVLKAMNDAADGVVLTTKGSLTAQLKAIATDWVCKVKDYISGGDKPPLSNRTVGYFRPLKGVDHSEPLLSSEQLLNAIRCEVFVEQTDAFASNMKRYAERLKSAGQLEKNRANFTKRGKANADFLARRKRAEAAKEDAPIIHRSKVIDAIALAREQERMAKRDKADTTGGGREVKNQIVTEEQKEIAHLLRNKSIVDAYREELVQFKEWINAAKERNGMSENVLYWSHRDRSDYYNKRRVMEMHRDAALVAKEFLNTHGADY